MQLAAKVVIEADEAGDRRAPTTFYEQKLSMATRRRLLREQRDNRREPPATDEDEGKENSGLPSVIAIPERDDTCSETEMISTYDLSTVEQSVPFVLANLVQESKSMSAHVLDQRFQQITDMLLDLQQQQIDSFAKHRAETEAAESPALTSSGRYGSSSESGRSQTSPSASGGNRSFGFQDSIRSRNSSNVARALMDPPASMASDLENASAKEPPAQAEKPQVQQQQSSSKPDPPAMQVLIGDLMQKLDPNGEIQTNDLDAWVQERLTPAVRRTPAARHTTPVQPGDTSQHDDRKPAAKAATGGLSTLLEDPEALFDRKWHQAEQLAQSPFGKEDGVSSTEAATSPDQNTGFEESSARKWRREEQSALSGSGKQNDSSDPPETAPASVARQNNSGVDDNTTPSQPLWYDEVKASADGPIGAIRVAPANPKPTTHTPEDDESTEGKADDSSPVKARIVVEDEHDLTLKKLSDAVECLQKKQSIMEATVQQAEQVTVIDDENADEDETFLERYGDALLVAFLAFAVGIFFGWKFM